MDLGERRHCRQRKRLREKPDDASLLYLLGEALLKSGAKPGEHEYVEAQSSLEKSVQLNPGLCLPHVSLGNIYLEEDRLQDAVTQLEKARQLDPSERSAYSHLAVALVNVLSCTKALGTRAPERFQSAFDKPMDSTKTGILASLTVAYDYCIDGLKLMNDADLFKMAVFAGRSESKLDIFWEANAHATHGLGKADVYLRLKGITPPEAGPRYLF